MKVIIDTNVVVSAALRDRDPEKVILFVAEQPDVQWIVSNPILEEYKEVLGRQRFALPEDLLHRWYEMFEILTTTVEVTVEIDFPQDLKDAKFLECALASEAEYLIAGDKDFSGAQKVMSTTIISVSPFKKLVCETWS